MPENKAGTEVCCEEEKIEFWKEFVFLNLKWLCGFGKLEYGKICNGKAKYSCNCWKAAEDISCSSSVTKRSLTNSGVFFRWGVVEGHFLSRVDAVNTTTNIAST